MTGLMWSNRGFWKVRIWNPNDRNTVVFALQTVTPQPMHLTVIQSLGQCNGKPNTLYVKSVHFMNPVTGSSFLSKALSFLLTLFWIQWKWQHFWGHRCPVGDYLPHIRLDKFCQLSRILGLDFGFVPYHFGRPDDNSVEKNYGEDWTVKSKFRAPQARFGGTCKSQRLIENMFQ